MLNSVILIKKMLNMVRKRFRLLFFKNSSIIILLFLVFVSCVLNIRLSYQLADIKVELEEMENSNTVVSMSNSKKRTQVVSSKFFNEYLPMAEGFVDTVYRCKSGDLTIGYGTNLSKNNIDILLEFNCLSKDSDGKYIMSKYQAKRAACIWIAENNIYFEQYAERYIGIQFSELPQDIKDFIVLICYKSGGPGLLSNKRETAKYIGEFVSCGEDTDSAVFVKMITSAGGGDSRQRIYKSIFQ